jgi:hypothetical protein
MSGWNELGDLLGGGLEARKEQAFQSGRFRAAQTEDALTNARVNQAKALRAEAENAARAEFAAAQARGEVDYSNPTSAMITQALLGDLGAQLPNAGQFNLQAQEFRNRNTLGDPNASALARTRAGDAVQGKLQGDIQGVTGKATYNLTDDTPELATLAGVDGGSTPADLQFYDRLMAVGGPNSPEGRIMMDVRRNNYRVTNFGDVPTQVRTGPAPEVAPLATAPQIADNKATITDATTRAKTTATTQAKLANALPGVVESLDTFEADIDRFMTAPGFDMAFGKSHAAASMMNPVLQPEEYRNANALLSNLDAQAFLNSIQKMRGLGALSNAEGEKVEAALTAALDRNQDEKQAEQSFRLLKQRLARFRQVAELEAGFKNVPGVNVAPGLQPPAAPRSFATEAEAMAAGVKPGERVIIGGVSGTWE